MGEVRDIPENARIHHTAILRMEVNEDYRYEQHLCTHVEHTDSKNKARKSHNRWGRTWGQEGTEEVGYRGVGDPERPR